MRSAQGSPGCGFGGLGSLEVGELLVVFAGCEEDVARRDGHDVEEGEDVRCREEEVTLRLAEFRVGG